MHSSRMRTGRSLTICCSLLPGGGVLLGRGGSSWQGGFSLAEGVLPGGGGSPWQGGFSLAGGVLPNRGEFSLAGGVLPTGDPPPREQNDKQV